MINIVNYFATNASICQNSKNVKYVKNISASDNIPIGYTTCFFVVFSIIFYLLYLSAYLPILTNFCVSTDSHDFVDNDK